MKEIRLSLIDPSIYSFFLKTSFFDSNHIGYRFELTNFAKRRLFDFLLLSTVLNMFYLTLLLIKQFMLTVDASYMFSQKLYTYIMLVRNYIPIKCWSCNSYSMNHIQYQTGMTEHGKLLPSWPLPLVIDCSVFSIVFSRGFHGIIGIRYIRR